MRSPRRALRLSLAIVMLSLGPAACRPQGTSSPGPAGAGRSAGFEPRAPETRPGAPTDAAPPVEPARPETRYAALTVNGNKIGYQEVTRSAADGQVTTVCRRQESARRGSAVLTQRTGETFVETVEGKPLSYRSVETVTGQPTRALECLVRDGKAHLKATVGDRTQTAVMDWVEGVRMPEGERLLRKRMGFKEGTTYTYRLFAGEPSRAPALTVTVGKTAPVELIGRTATLTELSVRNRDAFGNVTESASYVDGEGTELKFVMERLGMTMATIACDREYALGEDRLVDASRKVLPKVPAALAGIAQAGSATFTLAPVGGRKLTVPTTASQTVTTDAEGNLLVAVRRADVPRAATFPYRGEDASLQAATRPAAYLECNDKTVAALARAAVGETTDAAEAARKVERFVHGYVASADSVAYVSAAEVARTRRGDCTEYAVLTAAMLRSLGLPARVVVGVVYAPEAYGQTDVLVPHAWVQAYVGDRWVGLDSALGGFHPGHIALSVGDGDPESFAAVYATVGSFTVKSASVGR